MRRNVAQFKIVLHDVHDIDVGDTAKGNDIALALVEFNKGDHSKLKGINIPTPDKLRSYEPKSLVGKNILLAGYPSKILDNE